MLKFDCIWAEKKATAFLNILIAIILIGVALVPAIGLFTQSSRILSAGRGELEAIMAAQSLMDMARDGAFVNANMGQTLYIPDESLSNLKMPPSFIEKYQGLAEITFFPNTHDNRLRMIRVTVKWKEDNRNLQKSLLSASSLSGEIMAR